MSSQLANFFFYRRIVSLWDLFARHYCWLLICAPCARCFVKASGRRSSTTRGRFERLLCAASVTWRRRGRTPKHVSPATFRYLSLGNVACFPVRRSCFVIHELHVLLTFCSFPTAHLTWCWRTTARGSTPCVWPAVWCTSRLTYFRNRWFARSLRWFRMGRLWTTGCSRLPWEWLVNSVRTPSFSLPQLNQVNRSYVQWDDYSTIENVQDFGKAFMEFSVCRTYFAYFTRTKVFTCKRAFVGFWFSNYLDDGLHANEYFPILQILFWTEVQFYLTWPVPPRPGNPSWSSHRFLWLIANNFWLVRSPAKEKKVSPWFSKEPRTS